MSVEPAPNPSHPELLAEIQREFSECRGKSESRPQPYPLKLRRLAARAVDQGISPAAVARAAGVSRGTVVHWRTVPQYAVSRVQKRPIELRLRDDERLPQSGPLCVSGFDPQAVAVARIRFRSGVSLELPVSALSAQMLAWLQGSEREER